MVIQTLVESGGRVARTCGKFARCTTGAATPIGSQKAVKWQGTESAHLFREYRRGKLPWVLREHTGVKYWIREYVEIGSCERAS